uniref:NAD(P)H dehydrogenase, quinone 1 n=1 Tax=Sinocyclocheilus anshuiensis TaxID=1608454 RepID=A0A671RGW2_9TELE
FNAAACDVENTKCTYIKMLLWYRCLKRCTTVAITQDHCFTVIIMTLQKSSTRWSRQNRVLTQGFAFTLQKMYDNGIFKDKKAILSFTTGGTESMFQPDGIHGDFNVALWPLQNGVLRFCGFQVLAPRSSGVQHSPPDVRNAMLDAWQERLNSVFAEKPLLRPEVKDASESHGITTAQHLGKLLPPDNQTKAK